MSPAEHAHDSRLAQRLTEKHRELTWAKMCNISGIDATTIARASRGFGLEPRTYRTLMEAFAPDLELRGGELPADEPAKLYGISQRLKNAVAEPAGTSGVAMAVTLECSSFHVDTQGNLICRDAIVQTAEIVGVG